MIIFEFFFLHRVAKEVEKIVKNNGAIPATIAVISGKIHVGGCDLIFCCAFFFFFFFLERLAFKVNCSPEKNREELWFHLRLLFSKPFNWCFMLFNFKQTFFYYIVASCRLFCIKKNWKEEKMSIGLSEANLERLAQDADAVKTSRRDLPYVISKVMYIFKFFIILFSTTVLNKFSTEDLSLGLG